MWVERHLTTDASIADFAVDLSNVVRRPELGGDRGADLTRFTSLIKGLMTFANSRVVRVYAVADWSLLRGRVELTGDERATLRRWRYRSLIEVCDKADPRLLELADATGMRVVSRDKYEYAYRTYPWIGGNRDRFLWPYLGRNGVAVTPRIMPDPPEWRLSLKEEEDLLRTVGLYDRRGETGVRRDLLTRRWRCPADECPLFGAQRTDGQPLPVYRDGQVRCPEHWRPLHDLGAAPRLVQVKVRVDGETVHRFHLSPRQQLAVGRDPEPPGLALRQWLPAKAMAFVSRNHAVLRWSGTALTIRDVSTNGIRVRSRDRGAVEKPVPPHHPYRLHRGDAIVLDDGVELVVSGREFVFEPSPASGPSIESGPSPASDPSIESGPVPEPSRPKVSDVDR